MNIKAAFYWNGSKDKSISYMIIDNNFQIRLDPVIKKLDPKNFDSFKREAIKTISSFFSEIEDIYRADKNNNITIEYKIVSHGSPVILHDAKIHKPSDRTEFVKEQFNQHYKRIKISNDSLKLASQFKKNLTKPALIEFKENLNNLHIVIKQKNNAYQYHLWALALHATKSTYKKVLKKLTKAVMPEQIEQKDKKKRYAA